MKHKSDKIERLMRSLPTWKEMTNLLVKGSIALTEDSTWTPSMQLIFFRAKVSPVLTIMQIILLGATFKSTEKPVFAWRTYPEFCCPARTLSSCLCRGTCTTVDILILFQHLHTQCSFVVACYRTPSWLRQKHLLPRTQPANAPNGFVFRMQSPDEKMQFSKALGIAKIFIHEHTYPWFRTKLWQSARDQK